MVFGVERILPRASGLLLVALLSFACAAQAAMRTWTSDAGVAVEAEFVRVDGDWVVLRKADGKSLKIRASKLSDPDRAVVRAAAGTNEVAASDSGSGLDRRRAFLNRSPGGKAKSAGGTTQKGGRAAGGPARELPPAAKWIDREQARLAFEYLNKVRSDPAAHSQSLGVDLGAVEPKAALAWNEELARVAEAKASDMAERGYFNHLTPEGIGINAQINEGGYRLPPEWLKDPRANFFESIGFGYSDGVALISGLIIDRGVPGLGHRRHLLGMGEMWDRCGDAGIGIAGRDGKYYASVIIATPR